MLFLIQDGSTPTRPTISSDVSHFHLCNILTIVHLSTQRDKCSPREEMCAYAMSADLRECWMHIPAAREHNE